MSDSRRQQCARTSKRATSVIRSSTSFFLRWLSGDGPGRVPNQFARVIYNGLRLDNKSGRTNERVSMREWRRESKKKFFIYLLKTQPTSKVVTLTTRLPRTTSTTTERSLIVLYDQKFWTRRTFTVDFSFTSNHDSQLTEKERRSVWSLWHTTVLCPFVRTGEHPTRKKKKKRVRPDSLIVVDLRFSFVPYPKKKESSKVDYFQALHRGSNITFILRRLLLSYSTLCLSPSSYRNKTLLSAIRYPHGPL